MCPPDIRVLSCVAIESRALAMAWVVCSQEFLVFGGVYLGACLLAACFAFIHDTIQVSFNLTTTLGLP